VLQARDLRPAVFVDRDGVIIRNRPDYVKNSDEVEFIPRSIEALCLLSRAGHRVFVITNQSGLGRGLFTKNDLRAIHEQLKTAVVEAGGAIEAFFTCPHLAEDACPCRKPKPGLLYQARRVYRVDLRRAWVVGDHETDIAAARAAGCRSFLVLTGRTANPAESAYKADYVVDDLLDAAYLILGLPEEVTWQKVA
jgi:D-glycero-D-manno-heptose 1,7-bisphosphate phosphatase